jgi:glycosyltransferase involved in cell wall biosynthesis
MKIVQVIYSLELGGAERLVVNLSNQLSKKHEVYLLTYKSDNDETNRFHFPELSPRVKYFNLKLSRGINFRDVCTVYRKLREIKPDVVHCHLGVIFHVLPYALLHRKTKYFHTIHNDAAAERSIKPGTWVRRLAYKWNLFKPITISAVSRESFNQCYKLNNSHLIYNGCHAPAKTADFDSVKKEIENKKINADDLVFIHAGRQDAAQKNQLMLVKVFDRLIAEGRHLILLIIGNDYDKPEAGILKETAGKGIYFCGAKQNIADYYLNADAFCLSSKYEGMPISLLEALACGCIPICTPVGGIKDVVSDGVTGYLAKDTEENSYYDAVVKFLNNQGAIKKENLISYFNENYTLEKCAEQHEKLYLEQRRNK